MPPSYQLLSLPIGTIVSADRGLYQHVGMLTEPQPGRERHVLSLNPGKPGAQLTEEPASKFARGKPLVLLPPFSPFDPLSALARARSGQHPPYSWTTFNCEHFVCFAFGVPWESPQLLGLAQAATLVGALLLLARQA